MDGLDRELERYKQQHGGSFGNGFATDDSNTGGKVDIKTILMQGEAILWEGDGKAPKHLKAAATIKFFAIFWLGFAILWTVTASFAGGIMGLFGIPFIVVGIYLLMKKPAKPHYAITNMRVISLVNNNFNTIMLSEITSMRIEHQSDNTANIYFTTENPLPSNDEHELFTLGGMISRIQDGDNVYNSIENAVYDSRKTV